MANIKHQRWRSGFPWGCSTKAGRPSVLTRRQRRRRRWGERRKGPGAKRRKRSDDVFFTDVCGSAAVSEKPLRRDVERSRDRRLANVVGFGRDVVQGPPVKRQRTPAVLQFSGESAAEKPADQAVADLANIEEVPEGAAVHAQELKDREGGCTQEFVHLARYMGQQPHKKTFRQEFLDSQRYHSSAKHTDDGHLTKLGAKQVCLVCLQDHKAWECPQTRCYVCYETGHEVKQCPNFTLTCTRCHRSGHVASGCISYALTNASRRINWDEVRCVRCGEIGHPNCVERQCPPRPPTAVVPGPLVVRPRSVAPPPPAVRPPLPPPPPCRESKAERAAKPAKPGKPSREKSWSWHRIAEEDSSEEEALARRFCAATEHREAKRDRDGDAEGDRGAGRSVLTDERSAKRIKGSKRALDKIAVLRSGRTAVTEELRAAHSGVMGALHAKLAKQKGRSGVKSVSKCISSSRSAHGVPQGRATEVPQSHRAPSRAGSRR